MKLGRKRQLKLINNEAPPISIKFWRREILITKKGKGELWETFDWLDFSLKRENKKRGNEFVAEYN